MGCRLSIYECVHSFARHQDRKYQHDVRSRCRNSQPRLINVRADLTSDSLTGGFLMVLVGVLYILFEKSILSSTNGSKQASLDGLSGTLLGVQIGLIMLAMIVTRSSVASLQAKAGLPLGNQVVGWTILSMQRACDYEAESTLTTHSRVFINTFPPQSPTKQSLSPPPRRHLSNLLTDLHHSHHLLRRTLLFRLLRHPSHLGAS